jgi:hypothetical protein
MFMWSYPSCDNAIALCASLAYISSFVAFGIYFSLFEKLGSLHMLWHAFVHLHASLDWCIVNKGGENVASI